MSISLAAGAGGTSGSIQVGGADKLTLNADGSLVATANPATGVRSMALATMQKFADEFGSSISASGYQKLPSGLIIQWGSATTGSTNPFPLTFPMTFPTNALAVIANDISSSTTLCAVGVEDISVSGASFRGDAVLGATNALQSFNWIAIGH